MNICKIQDCGRPVKGYGLCSKHYQRFKRWGDTNLRIEYNGPRRDYPEEYKSWASMRDRCLDPKHKYSKYYSEKGIKICERWKGAHGFANFMADMGEKPSYTKTSGGRPIYTLDRIDANKGYSPDNCRWANWIEQESNRNNVSGVAGVSQTNTGSWLARFRGNGMNLGKTFKDKNAAIKQRKEWIKKYAG